MTLFLLAIGALLIVSGINNTASELFALVRGAFSGTDGNGNHVDNGFIPWLFAIVCLGALGYVPNMKPIANALLVLVVVVLLLHSQKGGAGFFQKASQGFSQAQQGSTGGLQLISSSGSSGGSGFGFSDFQSAFKTFSSFFGGSGGSDSGGFDLSNIGNGGSIMDSFGGGGSSSSSSFSDFAEAFSA